MSKKVEWRWVDNWDSYELYCGTECVITSSAKADDDSGLESWVSCEPKWRKFIVDALNSAEAGELEAAQLVAWGIQNGYLRSELKQRRGGQTTANCELIWRYEGNGVRVRLLIDKYRLPILCATVTALLLTDRENYQ